MAVACGEDFTVVVMEKGDLWTFGKDEYVQCETNAVGLNGHDTDAYQLLPACVGSPDDVFDGEAVVMVAAGHHHTACVTAKGKLWTWGNGEFGQLGHSDRESRQRPARLEKEMYGGSPAVMVACGGSHTLVLTAGGLVWSCGDGDLGQLGHGDTAYMLVLTLVAEEVFRGEQIVMVAAGGNHSVALGAEGRVWTWGHGESGRLGHNDEEDRLVPTQLAGEALGGAAAVLVAAGCVHTAAVTIQGALWVWGRGSDGRLGLGDCARRLAPTLVGAEAAFGQLQVQRLAGADAIEAQQFGNANIVSVSAGSRHSAAVTEEGILYTWGNAPGLGHADGKTKLVPTHIAPHLLQGSRVGRCHDLPPLHALAFAMGTHARLGSAAPTALVAGGDSKRWSQRQQGKTPTSADKGKDCEFFTMPGELLHRVVESCESSWPEGRVGELDGVVRLLGGGMMKKRGSASRSR
eukprot:CAMPEP_0179479202 /NCGR_PEP_ID=MMETSP0799-20121207/57499_1 /TAXON_ID=46947 /ORGANISM="Geminigera cryophila, Strain CCMP2564" /LENGTH=460 /DNA_ID=CAMNT_0021290711 /DNA_START=165 /DNA_END=1548 /DNA_ORIENTATION=-